MGPNATACALSGGGAEFLAGVVVATGATSMRDHAIAARPLVRDKLVAFMREGARAVGLEVFARPAAIEVGARLLAGLVGLAVGLGVLDGLEVTELVVVGAFKRLQVPPPTRKKAAAFRRASESKVS